MMVCTAYTDMPFGLSKAWMAGRREEVILREPTHTQYCQTIIMDTGVHWLATILALAIYDKNSTEL